MLSCASNFLRMPVSRTSMLKDPLNNTGILNLICTAVYLAYGFEAIDVHHYFEEGGSNVCTIFALIVYALVTAWLKQHRFNAMVTEWGAANGT